MSLFIDYISVQKFLSPDNVVNTKVCKLKFNDFINHEILTAHTYRLKVKEMFSFPMKIKIKINQIFTYTDYHVASHVKKAYMCIHKRNDVHDLSHIPCNLFM